MESRYTWKNQLLNGLRNFAILGGIVLLLVYLVFISGEAAKQELEGLFVKEKKTVTFINEPVAFGYENGAKVWELRSEVAEQEKETESSQLTRIYELALFKGGEENIIIRGDQGDWDKPREKLILTGNVVVESSDGTTELYTEVLIWEERNDVLSCPEFVDFYVEDNHITANSLYSDDDLATIDFVGDVDMFIVGLEGENFVTREGDFPIEDIEGEQQGDGMNVLAEYVHYDKGDRICLCYPNIPLEVQNLHSLDEEGRYQPEEEGPGNLTAMLLDPVYVDMLQKSVAELDLTPEDMAFLRGESDSLIENTNPFGNGGTPEVQAPGGMERTSPMGGMGGPGVGSQPGLLEGGMIGDGILGPNVPGPVNRIGTTEIDLPAIPPSDPEIVLTVADYSRITDWEISADLGAELFEGDDGFDPRDEIRDGLVFCYRESKKFWCEELYIDLGEHRAKGLRQVDGRFRDLKDEDREPPESRAARAIQESPTQIIGNYMIHNWRENVTEGYGRVLALQDQKDIEADNIIYYEDSDVMVAWGNVIVHQYSGEWWETSGAIEEVDDERAREDIRNPSLVTSDAILSYSRRVSWAFGNVVFRQEEQTISGDRSQYEEENEILIMAGNVDYDSDQGEKLACALLTLDLMLDEYIAEGAARSRSIVPEESRENLAEFRKDEEDRKPEDDARARLLENRASEGLGDWSYEIEHPPPMPPIEFFPGAQAERQSVPELGPEVPPPAVPDIPFPILMETNEGAVLPPDRSDGSGLVMAPIGDEGENSGEEITDETPEETETEIEEEVVVEEETQTEDETPEEETSEDEGSVEDESQT